MRSQTEHRAERGRTRRGGLALVAGIAALALTSCSSAVSRGWEPSTPGTTNQTGKIMALWEGSWIAALAVGVLVWGLIIWCVVAYRRRRDETGLPAQIRYHIPLEIMYTVIPLMMVGVLFYFTARDQAQIQSTSSRPDVTIGVVGKQWSWDFNYIDQGVYEVGVQGELNGTNAPAAQFPTLYLPVNKRVQFDITSRDVIHSFWIPAFLYKMDAIPGVENKFQVVPQRIGTYAGKCSELCGEYHSEMLFTVKVVTQAEFDQHIQALRDAGQTGQLGTNLGRSQTSPGGGFVPGNPAATTTTGSK